MTDISLRLTVALLALPLLTPTFIQAATPAKIVIDPQRLSDITRPKDVLNPMSPRIISTSRFEIVSPRPAPPYLPACSVLPCANG